MDKIVL